MRQYLYLLTLGIILHSCSGNKINLMENSNISLIGNNLCSRMINYDYFETEIQSRNIGKNITVRNMCDGGDLPGFRPHSGRNLPWAFEDAEKFYETSELSNKSGSEGHLPSHDQWLTKNKTDIIIAFWGYNESFEGIDDIPRYKKELQAFVDHTKKQKYNGKEATQLVFVSPIAFEDLSSKYDLPNGEKENKNLEAYTNAIKEVASTNSLGFIDVFHASADWYKSNADDLTIDGFQLNENGYKLLGNYLADKLIGGSTSEDKLKTKIHEAVADKNWFWHNDFKIPNGVHVFGRRFEPFGIENYPDELDKIAQMTVNRDSSIWAIAQGKIYDLVKADAKTKVLKPIETNYKITDKNQKYLYGDEALKSFTVAKDFKVELFASEKEFPDLANPVQLSFDNKGRLWVAVMPSYPHYKPGDSKPNDKLLILEDTNNDGKADKQTVFADKLHLPIGFEFAPEGVYLSQGTNLVLLKDTNNDDKADKTEIILSGFDDHDTHHAISAFCADPSGSIFMAEGVFLQTNVETPYGPVRATNGGFLRYNPMKKHLERTAQLAIPNPWGIAFDDWGQNIFCETSGPDVRWMMPGSIKPVYGKHAPASPSLFEEAHRVRPTSGLEFVSSRHFPDDMQGDLLINNTIGFLGMKQHTLKDDTTGFSSKHRQDVITSKDGNFRPVDMEFAPDGSLYLVDWHNMLVGHMQHNARDPLRDHQHGRIYRITHKTRPLVAPAKVHGASIAELLDNLKLPEYRTRYRSKRELRSRDSKEVLTALGKWVKSLDASDMKYEHQLTEALWLTWGLNKVDEKLLSQLLSAKDFRARSAAVRVLRYNTDKIKNHIDLFKKAAADPHGRVRLEAIVASSWLDKNEAMPILDIAGKFPLDRWMKDSYDAIRENFTTRLKKPEKKIEDDVVAGLTPEQIKQYNLGKALYHKEGNCATCHQKDGKGLPSSGFPPLSGTTWVLQSEERLIKLTLNGLMGPMVIKGVKYEGKTPMIPYGGLMKDDEIAAVLTFVRKSFGNNASPITADKVKEVREKIKDKKGYYLAMDLIKEHPW